MLGIGLGCLIVAMLNVLVQAFTGVNMFASGLIGLAH